ncbi:MAG: XcyI family restriction endonuclease [Burkholderiales bacterium]
MIHLPSVEPQAQFAVLLRDVRSQVLQPALASTVRALDIGVLDRELADRVPAKALGDFAARGLRGELLFATACVIRANPRLIGYYRLVLGFSQKAFYATGAGTGPFKAAELHGKLSGAAEKLLDALCDGFTAAGVELLASLSAHDETRATLHELSLLTLGAQFRGGRNNQLGEAGSSRVFDLFSEIVSGSIVKVDAGVIEVRNAARRKVLIEFAPDPDIVIRMEMKPGQFRSVIAVEIKAGTDYSNIHNRLGEAEKSHQKARAADFQECWTVINVSLTEREAKKASPSTNRFYQLAELEKRSGAVFEDFRDRVISLTGIKSKR